MRPVRTAGLLLLAVAACGSVESAETVCPAIERPEDARDPWVRPADRTDTGIWAMHSFYDRWPGPGIVVLVHACNEGECGEESFTGPENELTKWVYAEAFSRWKARRK